MNLSVFPALCCEPGGCHPEEDGGCDGGGQVGNRDAYPDAQRPQPGRKQQQAGHQEQHLAGQREEDGFLRHADGDKEVGGDHLEADNREDGEDHMQPVNRRGDQLRVAREHPDDKGGEELAAEEPRRGHADGPFHGQLRHLRHARVKPGAVVVTGNGLHPLIEAHDNHDEQEDDAVHDAVSADGHVASVCFQAAVNQDDDQAGAEVHQERRQADVEDAFDDFCFHPINAFLEVEELRRVGKMDKLPHQRDDLRDDGCPCRPFDAPAEAENEERVQHAVDDDGGQRRVHRHLGEAAGAQDGVQAQIEVRDDVAYQDDHHIIVCIRERLLACAEEIEYRVEEQQEDDREGKPQQHV